MNNSPEDASIYNLQSESVLIIDAGSNIGFGNGCNLGIKWIYTQDTQAIIWIINPDAYLPEKTLDINRFFKLHPEISILGTIIHTPTGEVWFAGGRFIRATGSILTPAALTQKLSATLIPSCPLRSLRFVFWSFCVSPIQIC